jgi:hypothetical protein
MISHKYKCIFIHIPKTAGTSIESAFGHLDGHTGREGQDHRSIRMIAPRLNTGIFYSIENFRIFITSLRYGFWEHKNPNNAITVSRDQYNSYFKFSVVRDPWDRAYSSYENVMRDGLHKLSWGIKEPITFNEFLRQFMGKEMMRSQIYWLKDFRNKMPFDYICRFENLQDDFDNVCRLMGVGSVVLPNKIKGSSSNYKARIDNESRDLIAEFYKEEIEFFNYCF